MLRAPLVALPLVCVVLAQQPATKSNSGVEAFSGWTLTPESQLAGYSLGQTQVDGGTLSVMTAPSNPAANAEANVTARITAGTFRGRTAMFSAWLRLENAGAGRQARLWIQADRPQGVNTPLDNLTSRAFTSNDWTLEEVAIGVASDAGSLTFGVLAEGGAQVEIRGESLNNVALPISQMPLRKSPEIPSEPPVDVAAVFPELPVVNDLLPPDLPEKQRLVQAAARIAVQYIRNLPDFLCTESIRRSENDKHKGWKPRDVLQIRLGFTGGFEHYRLVSINGKPSNTSVDALHGGITSGEFGSLLGEIFSPHRAVFDWEHWATLRGRTVAVFRYRVVLENSKFHLKFDDITHPAADAISAYHGVVYLDRETNEVLRLIQIAEPPDGFPVTESREMIDYDHLDIAGKQYLLPLRSEIYIGSATMVAHNVIVFLDYQKFSAESKIEFE